MSGGGMEALKVSSMADDTDVKAFVTKFNLDAGAVRTLEALTEDHRKTVISEFDPHETTRNIGAKLKAFATNIANKKGKGGRGMPSLSDDQAALWNNWANRPSTRPAVQAMPGMQVMQGMQVMAGMQGIPGMQVMQPMRVLQPMQGLQG